MAITVRMILDEKGRSVVTAPAQTPISEMAVILHQNRIGAVVIVNDDNKIAGILRNVTLPPPSASMVRAVWPHRCLKR
nr:CBS domain-containing protein [Marinicella sp. W31]MDC2875996.1 CBS domain-containing protein [Marinicella sp. W31]